MSEIKAKVRAYIAANILMGQGIDKLTDSSSFLALGILDSTGVLELIDFLESTFGIAVADSEMVPANLDSLDAIDRYVREKRAAASPTLDPCLEVSS